MKMLRSRINIIVLMTDGTANVNPANMDGLIANWTMKIQVATDIDLITRLHLLYIGIMKIGQKEKFLHCNWTDINWKTSSSLDG